MSGDEVEKKQLVALNLFIASSFLCGMISPLYNR